MSSTTNPSGELTLKQGGIMLLVIGVALAGVELATGQDWVWRGIPVKGIAGVFGGGGLILTVIGLIKKA